MRWLVTIALVLVGAPALACPINKGGPSPCGKLAREKYMTSTIYMRSVHARPPAFDQAKTTKFLTGARWTAIKADLYRYASKDENDDRRYYQLTYRDNKLTNTPALRFIDPATIKTSPKSTGQLQIVLVRQVDEVDGNTIVTVDGQEYALVECRRGKRISACLVQRAEVEYEKRRKDIANGALK